MLLAGGQLDQAGQTLGRTEDDFALDGRWTPLGREAFQSAPWRPPTGRAGKDLARIRINLNLESRLDEFENHLKFQLPPGHRRIRVVSVKSVVKTKTHCKSRKLPQITANWCNKQR